MVVGLTIKLVPVPSDVPPQLLVDQRSVAPEPPLAVNATGVPAQTVVELAVIEVGAIGGGWTTTV